MASPRATGLAAALLVGAALLLPGTGMAQDVGVQIVGGNDAEDGEYPWQIALFREQGANLVFRCGGTLIADTTVVTAAHCTEGLNADKLSVLVGSHFRSSGGTVIPATSVAEHPDYNSATLQHDAAVLELSGSGISAGGQPLQLIGAEGSADDAFWAAGDTLAISGWGSTSSGGASVNELREARVPRVADSTCDDPDWYGTEFDASTMVCAGFEAGGVDTCQGDSGGPMVASTQTPLPSSENNPAQWRLVGITSWGEGCALPKKPGVYTRVAAPAIRNWILDAITPPSQFALTVAVTGNGSVTSNPVGIDCPGDCSQSYTDGTDVTLTAEPDSGSTFVSWGGACSGSSTQCTVDMTQARSVTATFNTPPAQFALNVAVSGSGTVTSNPVGIDCPGDCSQSYTDGTDVTLTAEPEAGSTFAGWSGACTGTSTQCTVDMTQARSVTATFNTPPGQFALNVTVNGNGAVTSVPTGIDCPGDCSHSYTDDTDVTLTADPDPGSTFANWGGACSGTSTECVVDMTQARSVTANFNTPPAQFGLSVTVNGNGAVTSAPVGIDCPGDCSQSYTDGTDVTLTADPDTGSTFASWSGACSGTSTQCTVDMTQARSVTATFNTPSPPPTQHTLTVSKTGTGSGTVTSSPAGINCGSDCSQGYNSGTSVTLTATPGSGSTFAGWSGACSGTGTCNVTMSQARAVTASFGVQPSGEPTPEPTPDPVVDSTPPPDETAPVAAIASNKLRMNKRGIVRVKVDCSASPEDCFGDVTLRLRFPRDVSVAVLANVGHRAFEIAAGDSKRVKVRLKRRARRLVKEKGRVRARVIVVVEDAAGNTRKLRDRLPLLAPQ